MVFNALQTVFMVIVLVAVGYFIGRSKMNFPGLTEFISKFVINITVPCTVLGVFLTNLTKDAMLHSASSIAAAFIGMGTAYALSVVIGRLIKIERGKLGVFCMLFALSNAGFMGLPVAEALFGAQGMLIALFYFIANNVLGNSLGYIGICADGIAAPGGTGKIKKTELLRRCFSPPVIAVITSFLLIITQIKLPKFLDLSIGYLGDITSPLALLFLGFVLAETGFGCLKNLDKKTGAALLGRFVLSPLIMLAVASIMGLPAFNTQVFTVQTGLPAAVATTIFAKGEGADIKFAASGVIISTLLSLITIPVYVSIMTL